MHHKKDTRNKNKVKFRFVQDGIATFYFRPRNNMLTFAFGRRQENLFTDGQMEDNPYILKREFFNNENCIEAKTVAGGPKIIWDINNDTYQYIIPSNIDECGCYLDGGFKLYYSHPKDIPLTEDYLKIKTDLLNSQVSN